MKNLVWVEWRERSGGAGTSTDVQLAVDPLSLDTFTLLPDGTLEHLAGNVLTTHELGSLSPRVAEYLSDQCLLFVASASGELLTFDALGGPVESGGLLSDGVQGGAWSPDLELCAAVSGPSVVLLNRELLVVATLDGDPEELGKDQLESVGWGRKETQFHGSAGKAAAVLGPEEASPPPPWDDGAPVVSWKGDGEAFFVSAVSKKTSLRSGRIWTRDGLLSATLEPTCGLEKAAAWKPTGGLVAVAAQRSAALQVIFFERNGLRHGGFALRRPKDEWAVARMEWSADSTVIAIWLCSLKEQVSYLELWTCSNYEWRVSQRLCFSGSRSLVGFRWEPETPALRLHLRLGDGSAVTAALAPTTATVFSPSAPVFVVDECDLKVSELGRAIIPPPMCSRRLRSAGGVTSLGWGPDGVPVLAYSQETGAFSLWEEAAEGRAAKLDCSVDGVVTAIALGPDRTALFASSHRTHELVCADLMDQELCVRARKELDTAVLSLLWDKFKGAFLAQQVDGNWSHVRCVEGELVMESRLKTERACSSIGLDPSTGAIITLSTRSQLSINNHEVCRNVSSMMVATPFLLVTTTDHKLHSIPLSDILRFDAWTTQGLLSGGRSVERGSVLVGSVEGGTAVVLQMPRGNLETIHPRPLSLHKAVKLIQTQDYGTAMLFMRKQRLNLNLLYDSDPTTFEASVGVFLGALKDPALINLFILELADENIIDTMYDKVFPAEFRRQEAVPASKVSRVCRLLRDAMETSLASGSEDERRRLLTPILSTHMRGGDSEEALSALQRLSGPSEALMDAGIRHLLLLVDGGRLYEAALGTHDLRLVLAVAERSERDPKEFLPFLNDLRRHAEAYRCFKMEAHLGRWEKALGHLGRCDDDRADETLALLKQRPQLFPHALRIFDKEHSLRALILIAFAEHLSAKAAHAEAGALFSQAKAPERAFHCHSKALLWQKMIGVTCVAPDVLETSLRSVAQKLREKRKYRDAAQVYIDHLQAREEALECLIEGEEWSWALLMNEEKAASALRSRVGTTLTLLSSISSQWTAWAARLRVVRAEKRERWSDWAESGGETLDGGGDGAVSEASESTVRSGSSRLSAVSGTSSKAGKRADRKRRNLKPGGRFEDTALMASLAGLVQQADAAQEAVARELEGLVEVGDWGLGSELGRAWVSVEALLRKEVEEVWALDWHPSALPGPFHDTFRLEEAAHDAAAITLASESISLDSVVLEKPRLRGGLVKKYQSLAL